MHVNITWPKVCGQQTMIPISDSWTSYSWPLICCCSYSLHSLCWNMAAGVYFHSAARASVRSNTDVGRQGLSFSWRSSSSQRFLCTETFPCLNCCCEVGSTPLSKYHRTVCCCIKIPFIGTKRWEPLKTAPDQKYTKIDVRQKCFKKLSWCGYWNWDIALAVIYSISTYKILPLFSNLNSMHSILFISHFFF